MPTRTLLLIALTLLMPMAWAQDSARRVEREANNPMRMIIEAAKIRPKAKAAEAPKPVTRTTAEPAPSVVEARVPSLIDVPAVAMTEAPAAAPSAPAPASAVPEPLVAEAQPAPPPGPPESTVATVEVTATPRSPVVETPAPIAEPEPVALKLASVVEPVTPRRLLGTLRGEVQVQVAFTVNADGSVADAAVRRSSHPAMDAAVLDAVRQWRYEPIAAARPHEVQLVLRQPD